MFNCALWTPLEWARLRFRGGGRRFATEMGLLGVLGLLGVFGFFDFFESVGSSGESKRALSSSVESQRLKVRGEDVVVLIRAGSTVGILFDAAATARFLIYMSLAGKCGLFRHCL